MQRRRGERDWLQRQSPRGGFVSRPDLAGREAKKQFKTQVVSYPAGQP